MNQNEFDVNLKIIRLREMWHNFCELHTELYEVTCDEYMHLLSSEIDELENDIDNKNFTIQKINGLELERNLIGQEIAHHFQQEKTQKLSELLNLLKANGHEKVATEIEKLNLVLLDIVEKIQEQNKKNQVFLNKAILSLRELKNSFSGKTTYNTYSANGMTKASKGI